MLPIAEKFISVQGEGQWTGTPMFFIRLAGCPVGKGTFPFTCTAWNGLEFECDTDYRKHSKSSIPDLVDEVKASGLQHVCITGGEPLIHDETNSLIYYLRAGGIMPHIETSGTVELYPGHPCKPPATPVYITVAPKAKYREDVLDRANEIKVLVGEVGVSAEHILQTFGKWADKVWLQPINHYDNLNGENLERCLAIIKKEPRFKLSIQMHKVIGVR